MDDDYAILHPNATQLEIALETKAKLTSMLHYVRDAIQTAPAGTRINDVTWSWTP